MPATVPITTFSGAAPPWSLLSLDANFAGIASALANPQIGVSQSADSGGVNALIGTPSPAWPSYVSGTLITITPANTNTGNTTLNVSGLGTRSVLNPDGSQLLPGALQAGTPYLFMCGTSTFVLLGSSLVQATQGPGGTPFALRNRIINGDMRIDQRNAGASVSITNSTGLVTYTVDRWGSFCGLGVGTGTVNVQRINNAATAMGNPYALSFSVGTAKAVLGVSDLCSTQQRIEGLNLQDLVWGTASAKTITVSFTFVTSIANAVLPIFVENPLATRSYVTSITTGSANTPARYSVTIPGDVTGTWPIDNSGGINVGFTWAAGSNLQGAPNTWIASTVTTISGATNFMSNVANTWQITDLQLEAGSVATPFERIGFDMQLARCMRYYEKSFDYSVVPAQNAGATGAACVNEVVGSASGQDFGGLMFKVPKRTTGATITTYNPTATNAQVRDLTNNTDCSSTNTGGVGMSNFRIFFITSGTGAAGHALAVHWTADSEL